MTRAIRSSPNITLDLVSASMKNGSRFCKHLVTEWRGRRDLDDVELVLRRAVTIVTSIGQQHKSRFKLRQVLLCYGLADAVHRRKDHGDRRDLRPVGTETLNIIQRLPDLIDLEIRELPVLRTACKPQLFMMHLDARHEFTQTGDIAIAKPVLEAVHLRLQGGVIRPGLTTADQHQHTDQDNWKSGSKWHT